MTAKRKLLLKKKKKILDTNQQLKRHILKWKIKRAYIFEPTVINVEESIVKLRTRDWREDGRWKGKKA